MLTSATVEGLYWRAKLLGNPAFKQVDTASFDPAQGRLLDLNATGVTDATSGVPILGFKYINTCLGIFIYERIGSTLAAAHLWGHIANDDPVEKAVVRNAFTAFADTGNDLALHLIGASHGRENWKSYVVKMMDEIKALRLPNRIKIATFAVGNGIHPKAFACDARSGELLSGKEIEAMPWGGEKEAYAQEGFAKNVLAGLVDFDGRMPPYGNRNARQPKGYRNDVGHRR